MYAVQCVLHAAVRLSSLVNDKTGSGLPTSSYEMFMQAGELP
jgi:hypothetical protein